MTCRECCVGYHLLNEMPRVEDNMALETDVHAKGESLSAAALAMASGKHPKLGCHDELSSFGDLRRSPLEDDEKSNKSSSSASGSSTTTWNRDLDEPMLQDNPDRFCLFPIKEQEVWRMYKQAEASFWSAEEIDLSYDYRDWVNLTENEQHFISHVLAFFAASDGIVLENLGLRFLKDVQMPEARAFYAFQLAIENIHSETYGLLLVRAFPTEYAPKTDCPYSSCEGTITLTVYSYYGVQYTLSNPSYQSLIHITRD